MAHAGVTGKIGDRDSLQAQRPGGKQMKTTVPRKIINARGSLEKHNRCARRTRRLASDAFRQARDLEIVEPADESAFDALGEEFVEHRFSPPILSAKFLWNCLHNIQGMFNC